MAILHIGKQVPKKYIDMGYEEVSASHLGKGIWIFRLVKKEVKKESSERDK